MSSWDENILVIIFNMRLTVSAWFTKFFYNLDLLCKSWSIIAGSLNDLNHVKMRKNSLPETAISQDQLAF